MCGENMPRSVKEKEETLATTISLPRGWKKRIDEYMEEHGFRSYAELIRYLIRKEIIEKGENK